MSKQTAEQIKRRELRDSRKVGQTRLERGIEFYGNKDGRTMNAVYEVATSKPLHFSKRLERAYDIIKLSE